MEASPIDLPAALEPYRECIEKSVKPFVRIQPVEQEASDFTQSKFGGKPYWPAHLEYPVDQGGKPMRLLAQINFAEIPPFSLFPLQGILQFYLADDDMYGLDLDHPAQQSNFRVIYFEQITENTRTDFNFLPAFENFPVRRAYALQFEQAEAPVGLADVYFDTVFGKSSYTFFKNLGEEGQEAKETYAASYSARGHHMGGYAHFTQEDPRWVQEAFAEAMLLLQIDSDGRGIQWGDQGIANFFILPDNLQRLDFSQVLYNWDAP